MGRLQTWGMGGLGAERRKSDKRGKTSAQRAGEKLQISARTVERGIRVSKLAPELEPALMRGQLSLRWAERVAVARKSGSITEKAYRKYLRDLDKVYKGGVS